MVGRRSPSAARHGTVNDSVDCIKRMFKWAVGEQLLPAAVHQALAEVAGYDAVAGKYVKLNPYCPSTSHN
jgi:hypothetical protein